MLVVTLLLVTALAALVWLEGSVVVIDHTGQVGSAVITDGGTPPTEARLHRLWNGYFYGIPGFEGVIEVRCREGERRQWGYVNSHIHTTVRVVGQRPCQQAIVDVQGSAQY
jgi:hypothetical protein